MRQPVAILLVLLGLGCRSVWVHPQASAEKYADDLFFCQQGMERSEWEARNEVGTRSDRAWALAGAGAPGAVNPGWKHCMLRLGWDTRVGARSDPPWKRPDPDASRRPGGPK